MQPSLSKSRPSTSKPPSAYVAHNRAIAGAWSTPNRVHQLALQPQRIARTSLSGSAGAGPVQAYADALHNVFVGVLPAAVLAFLLSWFLEEVPLRSTRVEL